MKQSPKTASPTTTSSSSSDTGPLIPVDSKDSPLDGAVGYEISKQVNLLQLQTEIEESTGVDSVNLAITRSSDADDEVLWLTPAGIDVDSLTMLVANHQPDPMWGVPIVIQEFSAALSRLREDPDGDLPDGDLTVLVKGIALNFASLMPSLPPSM